MAKQAGTIILKGTLQGINFYKTGDGHLARKKSSLDKKRWLKDPAFEGQRAAARILGEAAKAYKLLKLALHPYMVQAADARQAGRTIAIFGKIIRLDSENLPAEKVIKSENLHLLRNWEANKNASTDAVMNVRPEMQMDRQAGVLKVNIPEYSAKRQVNAPAGATHYQVVAVVASVDFTRRKYQQERKESEWISINEASVAAEEQVFQFAAGTELPVIVGMGVRFAQKLNEKEYAINNMKFNAFKVVEVFV